MNACTSVAGANPTAIPFALYAIFGGFYHTSRYHQYDKSCSLGEEAVGGSEFYAASGTAITDAVAYNGSGTYPLRIRLEFLG